MNTAADLSGITTTLVESWDDAQRFMSWLGERRSVLACDLETEGFNFWEQEIRTAQFGDTMHGWTIPWHTWRGLVEEVTATYEGEYVLHNAPFDIRFLRAAGVELPQDRVHDTRIQACLIDPDRPTGLKPLSDTLISPLASHGEKLLKDGMYKNGWTWETVPIDFAPYWAYGALDCIFTARLHELQMPAVTSTESLRRLYDIERRAQLILSRMAERGFRVDVDYLKAKREELHQESLEIKAAAERDHGVKNIGSSKQLAEALLKQGWVPTIRTDSGAPSTSSDALEGCELPLAKDVRRYRDSTKIVSTYFDKMLSLVHETSEGWLIHAGINSMGARTGRMSVGNPPLQGLHSDSPVVRDAFIPRAGKKLLLIDYDQVELRVMADLADVTSLIEAFETEPDVHSWLASQIYGIPVEEVSKKLRKQTKGAMYTRLYGGGPPKFAASAGLTVKEGYDFYAMIDRAFPELRAYTDQIMTKAKELGERYSTNPYTRTEYGRYQPVPPGLEYKLANYKIQGTCADLLKDTIVELDNAGFGEEMLLPVHDEIVFEVDADTAEERLEEAKTLMTRHDRRVPLTVDGQAVSRWGDAYREDN